jgi:hypothetical protein
MPALLDGGYHLNFINIIADFFAVETPAYGIQSLGKCYAGNRQERKDKKEFLHAIII